MVPEQKHLHFRSIKNTKSTTALIFLHGLGGSHAFWGNDYNSLHQQYSLYFVDLPGFGQSPKPEADYSPDFFIEWLDDFIEEQVLEEQIVLVGHSLGALVALSYAARYSKKIQGLVLLSLKYFTTPEEAQTRISQANVLSTIMQDTPGARFLCSILVSLPSVTRFISPRLLKTLPRSVAQDAFSYTTISYFQTLYNVVYQQDVPALLDRIPKDKLIVIHGRKDTLIPFENVDALTFKYNVPITPVTTGGHDFPLYKAKKTATIVQTMLPRILRD
jgi:pimeloyl-ACP methyl ester carboxylesterase